MSRTAWSLIVLPSMMAALLIGQEPFKAGEEVVVVLDENNYIVDMHRKGQEGPHQFVTGNLIHVGMTKNQIKLHTPDGDKVFPLTEQAQKTKGIV